MKRKKLKLWRVEHDLTQVQLAEELGVTVAYINQIELGKQKPSYELLCKFKEKYDVEDVLELFEREEQE